MYTHKPILNFTKKRTKMVTVNKVCTANIANVICLNQTCLLTFVHFYLALQSLL